MPQRDRPTKETSHKKGGGGKSNRGGHNLGRALVKQQFNQARVGEYGGETVLETERGKHKLRSVTDCGDLEELMSTAALAGTDFTARRGEVVVLASGVVHEPAAASAAQPEELDLPVPRRPAWVPGLLGRPRNDRSRYRGGRRGCARCLAFRDGPEMTGPGTKRDQVAAPNAVGCPRAPALASGKTLALWGLPAQKLLLIGHQCARLAEKVRRHRETTAALGSLAFFAVAAPGLWQHLQPSTHLSGLVRQHPKQRQRDKNAAPSSIRALRAARR